MLAANGHEALMMEGADTLNDRRLTEEGEIVLDILGFASADEFYADAEL